MAVGLLNRRIFALLGSLALAVSAGAAARAGDPAAATLSPSPGARLGPTDSSPPEKTSSASMDLGAPAPHPGESVQTEGSRDRISVSEGNTLLRRFRSDQELEHIQLGDTQSTEFKRLKGTQKQQLKDWEISERKARHEFFAKNPHGPDRRAYVKDFLKRRKDYLDAQVQQRSDLLKLHQEQRDQIKQRQLENLREFQKSLDNGEKPERELWPKLKRSRRGR